MGVDSWFHDWLVDHLDRHPKAGLPPIGSDGAATFYDGWRSGFRIKGVHEREVADDASKQLMFDPPKFQDQHFKKLLSFCTEIYRVRNLERGHGHDAGSREAAAYESRDCPHCHGGGLVTVWHPRPSVEDKIPVTISAYCICPHGRWIRTNHMNKTPDVLRRTSDFAEVLKGRSVWLVEPPNPSTLPLNRPSAKALAEAWGPIPKG